MLNLFQHPCQRGAKIVISQHPGRAQKLRIDAEMYKWRHLIENFFCKLKEFKRIAMRACKTDQSFSAMIYLAQPSSIHVESPQPLIPLPAEDLFQRFVEDLRDPEGGFERRRIFACLDRRDGLTGHADPVAEFGLGHLAGEEA